MKIIFPIVIAFIFPLLRSTGALQCASSPNPTSHHQKIPQLNHGAIKPSIKSLKPNSSSAKPHAPRPQLPALYQPSNYRIIESSQHRNITESQHRSIRSSNHQPDSLPPIIQLHQSIDSFHAQQTHSQLLEFKDSKKGEWLKFLPNLGITYALDGQPRPSISLSSGILYQTQKAKQQRASKREQIIQMQQQSAEIAKNQLADLLLQYQQLHNEYRTQQELFAIETDLFRIKEDEYQRQELAPSDFLQAKRTYLLQQQAVEQKEHQLGRLISKIKLHCHY